MKSVTCLVAAVLGCMLLMPNLSDANTKGAAPREGGGCAEVGRYQLFQGSYTTFDLKRKETYVHQGVFLLDTLTGDVRRYINKIDENGRYIETWLPTDLPTADKR